MIRTPKYLLLATLIFFLAIHQCKAARIVIDSPERENTTRKSTIQDIDSNFLENYTSIANIESAIAGLTIGEEVQAYSTALDIYSGITPGANVQSLLGAADYAGIISQLGLVPGTNIQAYSSVLATYSGINPSSNVQSLLGAADYAGLRSLMGLVIGTDIQAYSSNLDIYSGITPSPNVQSLLGAVDYAGVISQLGLEINTNVQAYSGMLTALASLVDPNADRIMFWDDSENGPKYLTPGTGLSITDGTINVTGGGGTGDVVGPASSTDGNFPTFDGTTGKLIADSSYGPGDISALESDVSGINTTLEGLTPGEEIQEYSSLLDQIAAMADPNADRIVFWDDSIGEYQYLSLGTGLSLTGTTLEATGGGGGAADNPESWTAFSTGDATPSVATYYHFSLADTTEITTFDDPTDGKHIWVYCGYPAQFDVTDSGITAHNRTTDLTATAGAVLEFIYDATLTKWIAVDMPDETTSTLSSAEMRDIYTDESGDGAALFQNGDLGTPTAGDLSNCTNAVPADGSLLVAKLNSADTPADGEAAVFNSATGGVRWELISGGSTTYDSIPDATASGTIDIGANTILHSIATGGAMRWGTVANYFEVANDGGVIRARLGGDAKVNWGTYTLEDEGVAIQTGTATGDWATILQAYNGSVYVPLLRAYNNTTPYAEFGPPTNNLKVDSTGAIEFQGAATLTNLKCQQFPVEIGLAISDESTDLTTGTAKVTIRAPYAFTLTGVRASVNTAPVGSTIAIDINESGTSVLSTTLTVDAGEKTSTTAAVAAVISDSAIADDAELTFDIDQIGATTAGKGAKIWLIGYRNI